MTIQIDFSKLRILRRLRQAEARIAYLESTVREQREELSGLRERVEAYLRPPDRTAGGQEKVSVQQIMNEYLNFPDERREIGGEGDDA